MAKTEKEKRLTGQIFVFFTIMDGALSRQGVLKLWYAKDYLMVRGRPRVAGSTE